MENLVYILIFIVILESFSLAVVIRILRETDERLMAETKHSLILEEIIKGTEDEKDNI